VKELIHSTFAVQLIAWLKASIKMRYRKTWLGLVWVILNPVILLAAQGFVFSHILNLETKTYILYLVSGWLPWIYVSQTLQMGNTQLRTHSFAIKAFNIKPQIIVTSLSIENLINFAIMQILILLPLLFYFDYSPSIVFLWFLASIPLFLSVLALTFISSTSNVIIRDVNFVVNFLLSVLYFFTPIFYTPNHVPAAYKFVLYANPVSIILMPFQLPALPGYNFQDWILAYMRSITVSLVLVFLSSMIWKKFKSSFYVRL